MYNLGTFCARTAIRGSLRSRSGHTLAELAVVLALIAVTATVALISWNGLAGRTDSMQAARMVQDSIQRARMLAVLRGLNHFVVIDPSSRRIVVVSDTNAPFGEFDAGDRPVSSRLWPASVRMSMPDTAGALPSPIDGSTLTDGWNLPLPDTSGAWGATLRGVMATPLGTIDSVESSPAVIGTGAIVFAEQSGEVTSVGIRGQFGTVRWFRYRGSEWKIG